MGLLRDARIDDESETGVVELCLQHRAQQMRAVARGAAATVVGGFVDHHRRGVQRDRFRHRRRGGETARPELFALVPQLLREPLADARRLLAIARRGDHHVRADMGDIGVGKAVKPAHVDHAGFLFGREHPRENALADAFERGGRRHQHGHAFDVTHGVQAFVTHAGLVHAGDQPHGFVGAVVHVDVRVLMAGKHAVERIRHGLRDVAVQVERRGHRHPCADQVTHGAAQVAFQILQTFHDARAVQREEHAVERCGRREAVQDFLLERLVRRTRDGAGRLRVSDEQRYDLDVQFGTCTQRTAQQGLRAARPEHTLAAGLMEIVRLREVAAIRVGLVNDAGDGDTHGAGLVCCEETQCVSARRATITASVRGSGWCACRFDGNSRWAYSVRNVPRWQALYDPQAKRVIYSDGELDKLPGPWWK